MRRPTLRRLSMLVVTTLGGCSGPTPITDPPAVTHKPAPSVSLSAAPTPSSHRGWPVALGPLVTPSLAPIFDDWARWADHRKLFAVREQTPPLGFKGLGGAVDSFPGMPFARVQAYAVDPDFLGRGRGRPMGTQCHRSMVASDGTLCPQVIGPGAALSETQVKQLVSILSVREPDLHAPPLSDYPITHTFVFYDAGDRPIGTTALAASFAVAVLTPPTKDGATLAMGAERRAQMQAITGELGLVRKGDRDAADLRRQADADAALGVPDGGLARWLPSASGVDPKTPLRQTSSADRRLACAWHEVVWSGRHGATPGSRPRPEFVACGEQDDGVWPPRQGFRHLDFDQCETQFPQCDTTVGKVETCMRMQRFDPCLADSPQCVKLRSCLWGIAAL